MARDERPFRFQTAWLSHPQYKKVLHEAWRRSHHEVCIGLKEVKERSMEFNAKTFVNI